MNFNVIFHSLIIIIISEQIKRHQNTVIRKWPQKIAHPDLETDGVIDVNEIVAVLLKSSSHVNNSYSGSYHLVNYM